MEDYDRVRRLIYSPEKTAAFKLHPDKLIAELKDGYQSMVERLHEEIDEMRQRLADLEPNTEVAFELEPFLKNVIADREGLLASVNKIIADLKAVESSRRKP